MDKVTDSVRAFYEAYPYPPGDRVDCDGYQVRLLLSYVERSAGAGPPLRVLEAGCGRGLNLQAAAAVQPEAAFTGIDINRVAIDEARRSALRAGLSNIGFLPADLMQAGSLPGVQGGYDLILSYGVIHHLSDPATGLRHLRELLSPQGVVALMVDGRFGRQPLDRFLQAMNLLSPPQAPSEQRMELARALAGAAEESLFRGTHWQGTSEVEDVEFADRCLHVHERSYTVDELWQLLGGAGLRFLRWLEPADWQPSGALREPAMGRYLRTLDSLQRYRLIERLYERPKLALVCVPAESRPRAPLEREAVASSYFQINPQLKRRQDEQGASTWQLRQRSVTEAAWATAEAVLQASELFGGVFTGGQMATRLGADQRRRTEVMESLFQLEARELLFRPHEAEGGL